MSNILLDTDTVSMADMLGNSKVYRVPPFQRDYSWREEHWEDLWNDMLALHENKEQRHYMGSVVLQKSSDKEFLVIDGQQRLTTLSLVAIAIIGHLQNLVENGVEPRENSERVSILRRTYLGERPQ